MFAVAVGFGAAVQESHGAGMGMMPDMDPSSQAERFMDYPDRMAPSGDRFGRQFGRFMRNFQEGFDGDGNPQRSASGYTRNAPAYADRYNAPRRDGYGGQGGYAEPYGGQGGYSGAYGGYENRGYAPQSGQWSQQGGRNAPMGRDYGAESYGAARGGYVPESGGRGGYAPNQQGYGAPNYSAQPNYDGRFGYAPGYDDRYGANPERWNGQGDGYAAQRRRNTVDPWYWDAPTQWDLAHQGADPYWGPRGWGDPGFSWGNGDRWFEPNRRGGDPLGWPRFGFSPAWTDIPPLEGEPREGLDGFGRNEESWGRWRRGELPFGEWNMNSSPWNNWGWREPWRQDWPWSW
ncbi:hypothetical protein [Magnetofaba australis]|uniref:hypothetical protein n=1 Tax=Magnetofaba australis TaxID=1472297 RepID=UPI00117CE3AC|nr:hypothetical protein [Magnetofaba australis]